MTMKKYLDLFEAAPMPTATTAVPAATPVTTAKPIPTSTGMAKTTVKPGDVASYAGGPVDATARVPDISKAIPNTQSKVVNNPMQDFEESIEEELAEMMRLSGMTLNEKAVSKQQQKFMGMVHAMQKGEKIKGASAELKKVAKTMGKKDVKDFASTKHKGLPKKVTEDVMLDEGGNALKHIANRFKHEVKNFMNSGVMAENLYDALYDYYLDTGEMPYGIAKAREGDPYAWVEERFYADMGSSMSEAAVTEEMGQHDTLSELARLAGLEEDGPGSAMLYNKDKTVADKMKSGADAAKDFFVKGAETYKDQYMTALGMPPKKREVKEEELAECGDMGTEHEDSFNVSTNMSSDGTKNVTISAQGDRADELLQMLKMAGMRPHDDHSVTMSEPEVIMIGGNDEMMDEERETEYSNTPEEEYQTVDSILRQGNDLNREKDQHAVAGFTGDNPLVAEQELDEEISALLDSVLIREFDDITKREEPYRDPKTGKMVTPPKGLSISEPVYPAAKTPKMEPPSILDREKPYRDPKSGRMITPPKGLSISEPVYGAPNITKAK